MNPRKDPIVPLSKRPLIRRGMPYGPKFDQEPDAPRGLLGLFFCASLEDQFEHLLIEWGSAIRWALTTEATRGIFWPATTKIPVRASIYRCRARHCGSSMASPDT